MTPAPTLASHSIKEAVARARREPCEIDDVVIGAALQQGHQATIGRTVALHARFPSSVAGTLSSKAGGAARNMSSSPCVAAGAWARPGSLRFPKFCDRNPDANRQIVEQLYDWYAEGKIRPQIGRRYTLEQGSEAIAWEKDRRAIGKVIVQLRYSRLNIQSERK